MIEQTPLTKSFLRPDTRECWPVRIDILFIALAFGLAIANAVAELRTSVSVAIIARGYTLTSSSGHSDSTLVSNRIHTLIMLLRKQYNVICCYRHENITCVQCNRTALD